MAAVAERRPVTPIIDQELIDLPVAKLAAAEDNLRRSLGDVDELAQSITALGIIEPLVATPRAAGMFLIIAGHRRLAAAKQAGLETVPVYVRVLEEHDRIAAMLVENLQRSDLTPLEEAAAFHRLVDEFGMTQRELTVKVGRSQGHVSKRLALLELPKNVLAALDSGGITLDDARELTKLTAMPKRLAAAFARGAQWRGQYARAVADQLDEHKLAEKTGKAEQQLKETGIKVVAFKKNGGYYPELPTPMVELDGWKARELKLTPAKHKNEPCHAAAIRPRDGEVIYVCTNPATHKGKTLEVPADEKEKARKERAKEKQAQLRAREKNLELGQHLAGKLAAPAIDMTTMGLLAAIVMHEIGSELAQASFRYTDAASQTVVKNRDETVRRISHVEGNAARKLLDDRLAAATSPEEIMGVLLQALLTVKLADRNAVPPSQRYGYVSAVQFGGGGSATKMLDSIAASVGKPARAGKAGR